MICRKTLKLLIVLMFIMAGFSAMASTVWAEDEIFRISKEEAREKLDDTNVIFLDVRLGSDWRASQFKIKGAIREDPDKIDQWLKNYDTDKAYIIYCA